MGRFLRQAMRSPLRRLGDATPGRRRRAWPLGSALLAGAIALLALLTPGAAAGAQAVQPAPGATPVPTAAAPAAPEAGVAVPAGTRVRGVVVLRGPLDIRGTVDGSAISVDDIVVHPGARVTGDVISILGTVRAAPGTVGGQIRAMDGADAPAATRRVDQPRRAPSTWGNLTVVAGWLVVLLVIGLGVLVTASPYLDGVAEALEVSFARALAVGIVGQMLILPALLAVVVALAITIVGILAIPLGVVAFVLGVAGLVTLGFLAVAFVTGRSLVGGREPGARRRAAAARGDALRALTLGLVIYLAVWFAAAALSAIPVAAVLLRTVAIGVTWVAATAGFGAAIISRAGTRQPKPVEAPLPAARPEPRPGAREPVPAGVGAPERANVPAWQTPTPITGVVAARRPTPVPPPPE